jgi:hypothetical protein
MRVSQTLFARSTLPISLLAPFVFIVIALHWLQPFGGSFLSDRFLVHVTLIILVVSAADILRYCQIRRPILAAFDWRVDLLDG